VQIDDTVLRLSKILKKVGYIKNCLAPVNQIPPETLALTATFLATERDLINATAVCQQWRTALISFPRLWHNAGGSSSELEAYLERSKSVPLEVTLSYPHLVVPIIPHTPRLVALTICVAGSLSLNRITEHLRDPIPTLRSLEILTEGHQTSDLELPSSLCEGLFRHLKSLSLNVIPSFPGPQTFPHITELSICTSKTLHTHVANILDALGQLPGLVKVSVVFQVGWYTGARPSQIVTLPHAQEIYLCASAVDELEESAAILPILRFLELPKATSITIKSTHSLDSSQPILPITSFDERLPNYVELPELWIDTTMLSGVAVFRSPSGAVFTYKTGKLNNYKQERRLWGNLPVSSVRRVTAVLVDPTFSDEDVWLVDMLMDLPSLEVLELGGDCGWVLRRLRRWLVRDIMQTSIKTLTVHGGEYAKSQALKLESVKDGIGLEDMAVTYILDPGVCEAFAPNPDLESSSDDEDSDEDSEESSGSDSDREDDDE
jgi:hypothetical protein